MLRVLTIACLLMLPGCAAYYVEQGVNWGAQAIMWLSDEEDDPGD